MGTKKYYVVWEGKKTGVFSSWDTVKKLVQGYEGAKYKSFVSKTEADKAIKKDFSDYKGKRTKKIVLSADEKATYGIPIKNSLKSTQRRSVNSGECLIESLLNTRRRQKMLRLSRC